MFEIVGKYTTIRVSIEDKMKLKRLAKLIGARSITDALRYALSVAERELEKQTGDLGSVISSLKYARDIGVTNAEEVDKYIYGEG